MEDEKERKKRERDVGECSLRCVPVFILMSASPVGGCLPLHPRMLVTWLSSPVLKEAHWTQTPSFSFRAVAVPYLISLWLLGYHILLLEKTQRFVMKPEMSDTHTYTQTHTYRGLRSIMLGWTVQIDSLAG